MVKWFYFSFAPTASARLTAVLLSYHQPRKSFHSFHGTPRFNLREKDSLLHHSNAKLHGCVEQHIQIRCSLGNLQLSHFKMLLLSAFETCAFSASFFLFTLKQLDYTIRQQEPDTKHWYCLLVPSVCMRRQGAHMHLNEKKPYSIIFLLRQTAAQCPAVYL